LPISEHLANIRSLVGNRLLCLPSVTGIVKNAAGDILLVRNSGATEWTTPGGMIEPDDRPAESVVRELKEELNIDVKVKSLLGVFSGPEYRMLYPNGDQVVYTTAVFECEIINGSPQVDMDELEDCKYVNMAELAALEAPDWVRGLLAQLQAGEMFN